MSKLSPRELKALKANGLKFSVILDPTDRSKDLYRLIDGKRRNPLNTIRARSPREAALKLRRRLRIENKQINFHLKQKPWRIRQPYWTQRCLDYDHRLRIFNERWPEKPSTAITVDDTIDTSLIEFPDPPDFDIDDGQ